MPTRHLVVAVVLATLLTAAPEPTTTAAARPYLDAARETATWLRGAAVKTAHGKAWPATPGVGGPQGTVNTTLYSGMPGVVLFFIELHRATGRAEDIAEARAGADHLLATLGDKPQSGLYTGVAGTGFVLGETFK